VLRLLFGNKAARGSQKNWEESARLAVGVFRIDVARVGGDPEAAALAAELQETSPEFRRLYAENEVHSLWGGVKHFRHPVAGVLTLEYSSFAINGAEGLNMVVFSPVSVADKQAIEALVSRKLQVA
jgi:hypothetical protein